MLRRSWKGRRAGALALVGGCLTLGVSLLAVPAGAQVTGIDTPPPTGSGGFYQANKPITSTVTGETVSLVVAVEQTGTRVTTNGSITLSWNPADFQLDGTGSDASGSCVTGSGSLTCTYSDLAHTYKSVAYNFTALGPDPSAAISATAQTDGAAKTASFSLDIRPPLAIDAPPPAGTGGWYGASGKPIASAPSGAPVSLTVTALQPGPEYANGTFTLQWNPADFSYAGNSDKRATCSQPSAPANSVTCTYTDLADSAKSDAFHFTAVGPDPNASVVATVKVNSYSVARTFPLVVANAPTSKASCKKGGWHALTDDAGHSFKNQGDCVSYVATKGRNRADGSHHRGGRHHDGRRHGGRRGDHHGHRGGGRGHHDGHGHHGDD